MIMIVIIIMTSTNCQALIMIMIVMIIMSGTDVLGGYPAGGPGERDVHRGRGVPAHHVRRGHHHTQVCN